MKTLTISDSAYLLLAAIINQLRSDAISSSRVKCDVEPNHAARDCAIPILLGLNQFIAINSTADHIEISMELLRLHNGYRR
jgi:hypothetical protein